MRVKKNIKVEEYEWEKMKMICHIMGTGLSNILEKMIKQFNKEKNDVLIRYSIRILKEEKEELFKEDLEWMKKKNYLGNINQEDIY